MVLYPLAYVICTAPLAAGRMAAMSSTNPSLGYFCAAGALIACNGFLDALLYASTRANIVFHSGDAYADGNRPAAIGGEDMGLETFIFMGNSDRFGYGNTTTIVGGIPDAAKRNGKLDWRRRTSNFSFDSRKRQQSMDSMLSGNSAAIEEGVIGVKAETNVVVEWVGQASMSGG